MSEGEHNPLLPKLEKRSERIRPLPGDITERFLSGTLAEGAPLVGESDGSKVWRLYERQVELPGIGKALFLVDYHQRRKLEPPEKREVFDQMFFEYAGAEQDEDGNHPLIAQMHWYADIEDKPQKHDFDLMMVHRYVMPAFRNVGDVDKLLYGEAEAWAQQVANRKGEALTLALSTDQPLTMYWAENRGYAPYEGEEVVRQEILDHPERFEPVDEIDARKQVRNTALRRKDTELEERARVWFRKVLQPE